MSTAELALTILTRWHSGSRLTQEAYYGMDDIAGRCADELGEDTPDSAIGHSFVTTWLKAQNLERQPESWAQPVFYLGEIA